MVIGVYVLFNIISPIIKNKEKISVEEYNIDKYETKSQYEVDQSSMDERIERIYLEELKNNAISKFEEAGFSVEKCVVDAELDTKKKNAGIHSINVRITGSVDEGQLAKTIKMLAEEYEIETSKIKVDVK